MPDHRSYVVFGVSLTDPSKYGSRIFKDMLAAGYQVYAVNPKGGELFGCRVYKTLADINGPIYGAILVVPPAAVMGAVEQCIERGIKEIYFQPGARDPRAHEKAVAAGIEAVESCFMAENGLW